MRDAGTASVTTLGTSAANAVAPDPASPCSVSVVVPVYRSQDTLPVLAAELENTLRAHCATFELILVNDGSPDASWAQVVDLCRAHSWIRGINLMRNYGQHNALLCGIRAAKYPVIVTMDDDLQNPPDEIPRLLQALEEDVDVVYGPPMDEKHTLFRALASQVTKLVLQHAMGAETARSISAFRVFRTRIRSAFEQYHGPYVNVDVLLTWGTTRFRAVSVRQAPRRSGESNYSLRKLVTHTLNMVTGFSTLPLQLATLIGFTFTLVGIALLAWVMVRYLIEGDAVPGFPFLASTIALFSGAQLFALGIIGEYLSRMHYRVMDRPPYTIGDFVAGSSCEASADE